MEPTSDNPTSPKRRRFSSDNPFCDTSDTDASLDDPLTKTNSQLKLKPSHAENLVKESVLQVVDDPTINNQSVSNTSPGLRDHSLPSDHPPADDITFNGAFDDFNLDPREHNNLQTDWKRVLTRFHRCDPNVEGVEEINKTLKDLQATVERCHILLCSFCSSNTTIKLQYGFIVLPSLCGKAVQHEAFYIFDKSQVIGNTQAAF
jgi:hypothetical protein